MALSDLYLFSAKGRQLCSAQTAACRSAIIATSRTWRSPCSFALKKQTSLILIEPVTRTASELLDAFDAPYACSKFRTQQTRVCRFVGQPSDRRKPLIDRSCG